MVALLADAGPAGQWVARSIAGARLAAPDLMAYEVSNVLRRRLLAGALDVTSATLAHAELLELTLAVVPFDAVAARIWELRHNLTSYDAAYVAASELLGAPLMTLDRRIARAQGPRCRILCFEN